MTLLENPLRSLSPLLVFSALFLASSVALAEEPSPTERAVARTLFEDGRALAKEGKYAQACPKLEESERLVPGMGTLYNLADCLEKLGKTASAYSAFSEVVDLARRAGQPEREAVARERADALKPRLSMLKINLPRPAPTGLEVLIDGRALSDAALAENLPLDPGEHRVTARAPAKITNEAVVRIAATGPVSVLDLEPLQDAPIVSPPVPLLPGVDRTSSRSDRRPWQKPVALVAGGVALVAVGIGTAFGLQASSTWSDAKGACVGNVCDAQGFVGWEVARSSARVSTVLFTSGAILGAAALVMWIAAPRAEPTRTSFVAYPWGSF